jgi:hypothetical protein
MSIEKFEIAATKLVQDALKEATGNEFELVRAMARVLKYAIDITDVDEKFWPDENGVYHEGSLLRDQCSDILYGASQNLAVILNAFEEAGVPVIDYEDFNAKGGEL